MSWVYLMNECIYNITYCSILYIGVVVSKSEKDSEVNKITENCVPEKSIYWDCIVLYRICIISIRVSSSKWEEGNKGFFSLVLYNIV